MPVPIVSALESMLCLPFAPFTHCCCQDLSNPFAGMYSFASALDDRMAFLARQLVKLETRPETYVPRSVRRRVIQKLRFMRQPADQPCKVLMSSSLRDDRSARSPVQFWWTVQQRRGSRGQGGQAGLQGLLVWVEAASCWICRLSGVLQEQVEQRFSQLLCTLHGLCCR